MVTYRCVNDTDGDGDCAACARDPQAPCRQAPEWVASATVMTPEQRHGIDPIHEWYPGDGCPVCAREAIERRYAHLTANDRRRLANAARLFARQELDPRSYADGPHPDGGTKLDERWHTRQERHDRWREIADELYPDTVDVEVRP
jgi:hypothetical protein